ncbi:hypothetical protein [uncultured Gammaproteobacteria bacterium]|nr:hypothetical protein [uncultured Gammaproteobacteria bacterium]
MQKIANFYLKMRIIAGYLPSFWWKTHYFMGFINYIGLMQGP